jgi:hypothetical protein
MSALSSIKGREKDIKRDLKQEKIVKGWKWGVNM